MDGRCVPGDPRPPAQPTPVRPGRLTPGRGVPGTAARRGSPPWGTVLRQGRRENGRPPRTGLPRAPTGRTLRGSRLRDVPGRAPRYGPRGPETGTDPARRNGAGKPETPR